MEPFNLAITQINFESTDLPIGSPVSELSSFDTVVSYNEDFNSRTESDEGDVDTEMYHIETDPATGLFKDALRSKLSEIQNVPVDAYNNYNQGTRPPVVGASVELAPMPSVHTLGRTQHPLPSGPAPHPPPDLSSAEVHSLLRLAASNVALSQMTQPDHLTLPDLQPVEPQIHGAPSGFRHPPLGAPSKDSFEAFTKSIEALALQRSVITNPNVPPASEYAIAEALAKGEEKLNQEKQVNPHHHSNQTTNIPCDQSEHSVLSQGDTVSSGDCNMLISMTRDDDNYEVDPSDLVKRSVAHDFTNNSPEKRAQYPEPQNYIPQQTSTNSYPHRQYESYNVQSEQERFSENGAQPEQSDSSSASAHGENFVQAPPELIQIKPESVVTTRRNKGKTLWLFGGGDVSEESTSPPTSTRSATQQTQYESYSKAESEYNEIDKTHHSNVVSSQEANQSGHQEMLPQQVYQERIVSDNRGDYPHQQNRQNMEQEISRNSYDNHHVSSGGGLSQGYVDNLHHPAPENIVSLLNNVPADMWTAPPRYQTTEDLPSAPQTPTHILPERGHADVYDWSAVPLQNGSYARSNASGYDTPVSNLSRSSSFANLMGIETNLELEKVLREKAKLEGHIEFLEIDKKSMTHEKLELQNQVAKLTSQLQVQKTNTLTVAAERDALLSDMETLRQNRSRLEQVILDEQKQMDDRTTVVRSLEEDLEASTIAVEKLQDKLKLAREDMSGKDNTIHALKAKISELYVDVQNSVQSKIHADLEVKSMKDEIATLVTTREWYQQQLKSAQESRNKFQADVAKVQATSVAQAAMIERLRVENAKIRHHLVDTQQAALKEKELIARHLEGIELDMLERETAYEQIQKDRLSVQETLHTKIQKVEEEKLKLSSIARTNEDFEEELQKMKNEIRVKTAHISVLEHEQAELMKRLAMSQECLKDRDQSLESLEQRNIDIETNMISVQKEAADKDDEIRQLKEDRTCMEVALEAARGEKERFDGALLALKDDMRKVEKSFKQIRNEVEVKTKEVEYLELEKAKISAELEELKQKLKDEPQSFGADSTAITNLKSEFSAEKSKLLDDILSLQKELTLLQTQNNALHMDKNELEEMATSYKRDIAVLQTQVASLQSGKLDIQSEMEKREEDVENAQHIVSENVALKEKLNELQSITHKQNAKNKGKVLKLSSDVNKLQRLLKEKTDAYDNLLSEKKEQERLADDSRDRLERQVQSVEDRFKQNVDDQMVNIQMDLQAKNQELEEVRHCKEELEKKLRELKKSSDHEILKCRGRAAKLDKELKKYKDYIDQTRKSAEANRKTALELEREKGRLAGVIQNHTTLKEHVETIEEELAKKEFHIIKINAALQSESDQRDKMEAELQQHIQQLEKNVSKEKQTFKECKKQLMTEKGNHIKLKRELQAVLADMKQLQAENVDMSKQIEMLQQGSENTEESVSQHKAEMERLNVEYTDCKLEVERLQRQLNEQTVKSPVIQEQIQAMERQIELKASELVSHEEQTALTEERHQTELASLKISLQDTQLELGEVRKELAEFRVEKLSMQSKLSELRGALKAGLEQIKNLDEEESAKTKIQYDVDTIEKLLVNSNTPTHQSRTLSALQECLFGLRSNIGRLQQQMGEHTAAVQHSSKSWKEVEAQIKDLRDVCRSGETS